MNKFKQFTLVIYKNFLQTFSFGLGISKYWPLNKTIKHIESSFIESSVKTEDHIMFLDKGDNLGLSINPIYGESDTKIVKKLIKNGDVVLDIGANIGYYTLIFAKLVGNSGKVFAFEPEPENFKILQKNIKINEYANVFLEQKAVSNNNEKLTLYISDKAGSHRIYKPEKYVKSIDIESITIDNYLKKNNIKKIDFVKIDVEGAELNVLQGIQNLLDFDKNIVLFIEFSPNQIQSCGLEPFDLINFLEKNNFKIYFAEKENNKTQFYEFNKIYSYNKYKNKTINLLCSKNSLSDLIK